MAHWREPVPATRGYRNFGDRDRLPARDAHLGSRAGVHGYERPADLHAPAGSAPAGPTAADYGLLASAHLFGEAPKVSAPVFEQTVVDAPDTTLSLLLTGILAADAETDFKGQAIISSNRGQERTYQIGQEIESANGTRLHSVHPDRVLLNRGDRLETLRFPETPSASASPAGMAGRPSLPPAAAPAPRNDSLRRSSAKTRRD